MFRFLYTGLSPSLDVHPEWCSEPLLMGWSESSYGYRESSFDRGNRHTQFVLHMSFQPLSVWPSPPMPPSFVLSPNQRQPPRS